MLKKMNKKKQPNDYPQLIFRISEEEKELILKEVDRVCIELNKKRKENEKVIRKNHVIVEAIKLGLKKMSTR